MTLDELRRGWRLTWPLRFHRRVMLALVDFGAWWARHAGSPEYKAAAVELMHGASDHAALFTRLLQEAERMARDGESLERQLSTVRMLAALGQLGNAVAAVQRRREGGASCRN